MMKTALEFPTKLGEFDVDADGFLSSDGQDLFPTYGASGGLTCRTVRYRLVAEETSNDPDRR
jgi:hypothetical protein